MESHNLIESKIDLFILQMSKTGALSQGDKNEVKDYFLSEIELLSDSNLSVDEQFIIAQQRFGSGVDIMREYQKVNRYGFSMSETSPLICGSLALKTVIYSVLIIIGSISYPDYVYFNYEFIQTNITILRIVMLPLLISFFYLGFRYYISTEPNIYRYATLILIILELCLFTFYYTHSCLRGGYMELQTFLFHGGILLFSLVAYLVMAPMMGKRIASYSRSKNFA